MPVSSNSMIISKMRIGVLVLTSEQKYETPKFQGMSMNVSRNSSSVAPAPYALISSRAA